MSERRTGRRIRGRLADLGERLRRRRGAATGEAPPGGEGANEPTERLFDESVAPEERSSTPEPAAPSDPPQAAASEPSDEWERPILGDLGEGRREAMRRRLGALRGSGSPGPWRGRAGRAVGVIGSAFAAVGSAIVRGGRAAGSAAGGAGQAVSERWLLLPLIVRQRIAAGAALAALAAFVWLVLVPVAPCQVPGGDRCPPPDEAISLVPADAAVYVHLNLDRDTEQYEAAAAIAERLPLLVDDVVGQLPAATDRQVDFEAEVRPWSGGEVAIALIAGGAGVDRLLLIESDDDEAALEFGRALLARGTSEREVEGVEVSVDEDGQATGLVDGFLVIGPEQAVSQVIAASGDEVDRLADDGDATEAIDRLPDHRLAELYISGDGARTLAADGALGPFETFVNSGASLGVAAALSFGEDSFELTVRSVLDPDRAEARPGVLGALAEFDPELDQRVRGDALAYLGLGNPSAGVDRLLEQAEGQAPGLLAGFDRFSRRLRRQGGVNLRRDLLPLLEGEAALTVEPATAGGEDEGAGTPGLLPDQESPYVGLIASGVDIDAARGALAELQGPIAETVDPAEGGQAPVFRSTEVEGVEVQSLRVSPVVEIAYALFDESLVAGTKLQAVERVRADGERLDEADAYREATEDLPDSVALLLYLNLADLLALGEQVGLGEDPAYVLRAQDLRSLRAAVLGIGRSSTELATDLRVTVGERAEPVLEESPLDQQPPVEEELEPESVPPADE